MDISKGDVVISLAGRDRDRLFFVLDAEGDYARIADGKIRKLEKPKRKKRKHLRLAVRAESHVAEKLRRGDGVLDSELRRELAILGQTFNSQNQGGD